MTISDLSTLIRFNFWANDRILAACKHITADEFVREHRPDPGWGSLRAILVHTLDAEYGWRSLLQSLHGADVLNADDFNNVEELKIRWDRERAAWFDYVDRLSQDSINLRVGDDPESGMKVWQTIVHVVTHGNQHRGEAAWILTGYGQSPGELDFDLFMQENPELSSD